MKIESCKVSEKAIFTGIETGCRMGCMNLNEGENYCCEKCEALYEYINDGLK